MTSQVPCEYDQNSQEIKTIIEHLKTTKHITEENLRLINGENPFAILTIGGPGAGKSSSLSILKNSDFKGIDFSVIDPDTINEIAFHGSNNCRRETNSLNDEFFNLAKRYKRDLIFDTTGRIYDKVMENVINLHLNGYSVILCIVLTDENIAIERATSRYESKQSNRQISSEYIHGVFVQLMDVIKQYIIIPNTMVDYLYVYENSSNSGAKLILERKLNGSVNCIEPELVEKWFGEVGKNLCNHGNSRNRNSLGSDDFTTAESSQNSIFGGRAKSTFRKGRAKTTFRKGRAKTTFRKGRAKSTFRKGRAKSTFRKGRAKTTFRKGRAKTTF
jgi:hypothetical protein